MLATRKLAVNGDIYSQKVHKYALKKRDISRETGGGIAGAKKTKNCTINIDMENTAKIQYPH